MLLGFEISSVYGDPLASVAYLGRLLLEHHALVMTPPAWNAVNMPNRLGQGLEPLGQVGLGQTMAPDPGGESQQANPSAVVTAGARPTI